MQTRQLLIFIVLSLIAAAVVTEAVSLYQERHARVEVDAPAVRVDTDKPGGGTSVDAPGVHIENDKNGVKVQAPGVDIEVPPKQPQN
ncbi:MAG: hypothetical protein QM780_07005 [Hyphomicrobium sp.]|uniref:hypothetical protein n=1 Tax=Hyphomicrobium sp. TaxID=82 RepID=UPI0039E5918D